MSRERYTRREFLTLSAGSVAAAWATGCAVNPVTGQRQLMFVSEAQERALDQQWAPHQFSADYGAVQDETLNRYVADLQAKLAPHTHRPLMPYNARVVNAVALNAYTFPAGSMGYTRGLLLALDNEAELAAVMGHEMGHVNARHAASSQTRGMVTQMLVAGVTAYVEAEHEDYTLLAAGLGGLGGHALLSRYSRDNEREADELGMEYMARGGYTPAGMVGVMDVFRRMDERQPGLVYVLFATHPMSEERYQAAVRRKQGEYRDRLNQREGRERHMDSTADLRKMAEAIDALQQGRTLLGKQKPGQAETHLETALEKAPDDYGARVMMAKCQVGLERYEAAAVQVAEARTLYPAEPQAMHVSGLVHMLRERYEPALADFVAYEDALPGNPNTVFFQGHCLDKMGRRSQAADAYVRYLNQAPNGQHAPRARARLETWGLLETGR